jgi:hypothetical protein
MIKGEAMALCLLLSLPNWCRRMRLAFLGALMILALAARQVDAQAPTTDAPSPFYSGYDATWQPPRTELDPRPNLGPKGNPFYGQIDYLQWWTEKDQAVYPRTPGQVAASFGDGTDFGAPSRQGVDGVLGMWLDQQQSYGIEAGVLWLSNRNHGWVGDGDNIALRNDLAERLWGAEADGRWQLYRGIFTHLDLLAGMRFLSLDESLDITQRDLSSEEISQDRLGARNRFFGGQLGLEAEGHYGSWSIDAAGKVALGANWEAVSLGGTTVIGGQVLPGGFLVSPASGGRYSGSVFATVSEIDVQVGYELMDNIRLQIGYSFLYFSDVVRPGEQVQVLQSGARGSLPAANADFWGQGLNVGLEFRF